MISPDREYKILDIYFVLFSIFSSSYWDISSQKQNEKVVGHRGLYRTVKNKNHLKGTNFIQKEHFFQLWIENFFWGEKTWTNISCLLLHLICIFGEASVAHFDLINRKERFILFLRHHQPQISNITLLKSMGYESLKK